MTPSHVKITINGIQTADFLILLDLSVENQLNRHSTCRFAMRQPPSSRYFYEPDLGKDLVIHAIDGAGAELELFNGLLRRVDAEWEMNGSCVLHFEGISRSYTTDTLNDSKTWNRKTLDQIFQTMLSDLAGDFVGPGGSLGALIQYDETDWSFLHRLADRYCCFLRPKGRRVDLYSEFQPGNVELRWSTEFGLQSFRTTGQIRPTLFFGVNYDRQDATSDQTDMLIYDVGATDALPELRSYAKNNSEDAGLMSALWEKFLSGTHAKFVEDMQNEAARQIIHTCTARGESRVPEITTGEMVKISGLDDIKGEYGVFRVVHRWQPARGYHNEFWCTPYKCYLDPAQPKRTRFYGPLVARVAQTSHADARMAYIRVNFLWERQNDSGWMPVLTPNAGAGRGFCFIPEVGDEVLVFFRGGDSCKPIVLGSQWNGVDLPPLEDLHGGEYENNDIKRIVTKSGNRLVFDDKQGSETMVMATPEHIRITMLEGEQTLLIHSDGDINIHAGGTVHIKCNQFLREVG